MGDGDWGLGLVFLVSLSILHNLRNLRINVVAFKTTNPQIAQIYADEAEGQKPETPKPSPNARVPTPTGTLTHRFIGSNYSADFILRG